MNTLSDKDQSFVVPALAGCRDIDVDRDGLALSVRIRRRNRVFFPWILCGMVIAVLQVGCRPNVSGKKPLIVFCAAGMKTPVSRIAKEYEHEYSVPIHLQYGGSGTLLSNVSMGIGDIYLAADSSYTEIAKNKGLMAETMPVARMHAGLGVPAGNPRGLTSLADLKRTDLKVGLASPEMASIGKFTKQVLSQHGLWDQIEPTVFLPTVNELMNALKLGTVDTVVCWDAVAHQYDEIDFVGVPEFQSHPKNVTVGILDSSGQPTEALRFCRYLSARDRGLPVFREEGFQVVEGDVWAKSPQVLLFSGAMLRPAIQDTVKAFEQREGVRITPVYNGCGVLVSQMLAGENPDAYLSCDVKFLEAVEQKFLESTLISANELVILTEKGNPREIGDLADLLQKNLRVGLAHPEKSALGFLSSHLLQEEGLYEKLVDSGNLVLTSPTGDFLVSQIKAGSIDAVIVYKSNAMSSGSTLKVCELIEIDRPNAVAHQPYAVAKNSQHRYLLERFYDAVVSTKGREQFVQHGFRWELDSQDQVPRNDEKSH